MLKSVRTLLESRYNTKTTTKNSTSNSEMLCHIPERIFTGLKDFHWAYTVKRTGLLEYEDGKLDGSGPSGSASRVGALLRANVEHMRC